MNRPFTYVIYIQTTPEKLWKALTLPEFTRKYWFGNAIDCDWKAGSAMKMLNEEGELQLDGKVLKASPFSELSYTSHRPNEKIQSTVNFTLMPTGDSVKLTLVHDGYSEDDEAFHGISAAWPAILSGLKTLLESGKAPVYGPRTQPVPKK